MCWVGISRRIQGLLLFNNETNQWMRYGAKFNGIWAAESENAMQQIVTNAILAKGYEGWGSHHYVVNVLLSMRSALLQREWNEKPTNEFLPSVIKCLRLQNAPGFRFTWLLERDQPARF